MKKLAIWTAGGLAAATACGLAGLPQLSVSLVILIADLWVLHLLFGLSLALPDRVLAWLGSPEQQANPASRPELSTECSLLPDTAYCRK